MAVVVAGVKPVLETCSVYPLPAWFRIKPDAVATPFFAVAFVDPVSVPPLGPDATVIVSLPLKLVATLPY